MSTTSHGIPPANYPDPAYAYSYAVDTTGGLGYGSGGGYTGYSFDGGGFGSYGLGGGMTAGYPKGSPDRKTPALMGWGGMQFIPDGGVTLSKSIDDVVRNLGPEVYSMMMNDDAVSPAVAMLVYAILGGEIHVEPAIVAEPGERLDGDVDPQRLKDIEDAKKYAEECKRSLNRCPELLDELEAIVTDGLVRGSSLGDMAWEVVQEEGDEKPLTLLKSVQCRPAAAWAMVIDQSGQFDRVVGYTPEGPKVFDRDRFFVYINARRRGDPRGTSDLRPAYDAWNFKTQSRPERSKWCSQFATPTVRIIYDGNVPPAYAINADGTEDTSQLMSPQAQAERIAANVHSGSWMALPQGWEGDLIESKNDGGAFSAYEEECNKAITMAILMNSRTLNEAAHGSKADSESSVSTTMIKVDRRQRTLIREIERSIFRTQVVLNHGEQAARLCPRAKFPDPDTADLPAMITAFVAAGWKSTPRQGATIDARLGLPIRTADEIDEQQQQEKAAQQATVEAMKAKANPPGMGGPPGQDGQPADPGDKKPGDAAKDPVKADESGKADTAKPARQPKVKPAAPKPNPDDKPEAK